MSPDPYRLARTTAEQVEWVVALERLEHAAPFVGRWTTEQHREALNNADALHLTVVSPSGDTVGFVVLLGLENPHRAIELKRIVIDPPGLGHGRHALRAAQRVAFDELGAHRLWLDVKEHNARARSLYLSVGFSEEGTASDAVPFGGRFEALVIMSMLEAEFRSARELDRI